MDLSKALRMIARRWYVAVCVLVICAAATFSLVSAAAVVYSSEATIILLPPTLKQVTDVKVDTQTNPFLETGIAQTANALASASNSDRVADQLKAAGLDKVTFEVRSFDQSTILLMKVESPSKEGATRAVAIVVDAVQSIASSLQVDASAPQNQLVTAQVLAPPPAAPVESLAAKTKIAMGMAVASVLIVLCATLLFDRVAVHHAERRRRQGMFLDRLALESLEPEQELSGDETQSKLPPPVPADKSRGTTLVGDLVDESSVDCGAKADGETSEKSVRRTAGGSQSLRAKAGR